MRLGDFGSCRRINSALIGQDPVGIIEWKKVRLAFYMRLTFFSPYLDHFLFFVVSHDIIRRSFGAGLHVQERSIQGL